MPKLSLSGPKQVVVALLECLQESGGPVCAAAARVIEDVIGFCKLHQRSKLRAIPPLPHWVQELERANQVRRGLGGMRALGVPKVAVAAACGAWVWHGALGAHLIQLPGTSAGA